jgi:hypothetical protein
LARQNLETRFKHAIIDSWYGFFRRIEPGRGGDAGFPDLILGTAIGLVLTELKIGTIEDGVLWTSNIRPAQLVFAREISDAGFPAIFLVGVQESTKWRTFIFNAVLAHQFDTVGFKIGIDCFELPCHDLMAEVDDFLYREFGE